TDPCQVQVTLVDENDQPFKSASATLQEFTRDQLGKVNIKATSLQANEAGQIRLTLPPRDPKQYRSLLLACDLEGRDLAFCRLPEDQDTDVRLVIRKSGRPWQGKVTDSSGKAIPNATIRVTGYNQDSSDPSGYVSWGYSPELPDDPKTIATSDSEGRFQLPRFARLWTNVRVSAPGYSTLDTYFDPSRDSQSEYKSFALSLAAHVKGRVVLKGTGQAPTEAADGSIYFQNPREGGSTSKVQPDWSFSADDLKPGKYRALIYYRDNKALRKYVCSAPPDVEAVAGKTLDVVIELEEGIPLRGKLVDAKTNKPLEGYVYAQLQGDPNMGGYSEVEKDGSWLGYLPREGEYVVKYYLMPAREPKAFKTITVRKSEPLPELVIQADPGTK
ncbi:MAG TPA: carboxypeptidase-like regulatory domain-containing protein, partial [Tepidisphaeraceae bacterium]|nr:carboxypeptidase-like regulatory domain-containing protein [Tepidisphaeraceae bacterium]